MAQHRLLIHFLCPQSRRVLYALGFKNIEPELIEVDLFEKPEILTQNNPNGTAPVLLTDDSGAKYVVYDALEIMEVLDCVGSGVPLLPLNEQGKVDIFKRPKIKNLIEEMDKLCNQLLTLWKNDSAVVNEQFMGGIKKRLSDLNQLVSQSNFMGSHIIGEDVISLVDLAVFPFIQDMFLTESEKLNAIFNGEDLNALRSWYDRVSSMPEVAKFCPAKNRIVKLANSVADGTHQGLRLPLEFYDS